VRGKLLIFNIERPPTRLLSHSSAALLPDFAHVPKDLAGGPVIRVTAPYKKETAMKQSHHIPPHRTPIKVIRPTLRRGFATTRWRMTNVLTAGAALLAVALSVSLSAAATDKVCTMPLDQMPVSVCP
jgi:hypothetical protein